MKHSNLLERMKGLGLFAVEAAAALVAICSLLSMLVMNEVMNESIAEKCAMIIIWVVIFTQCYMAARKVGEGKLTASLLTFGAMVAGLMITAACFGEGAKLSVDWRLGVMIGMSILAGVATCQKRRHRR